MSSPNIKEKSKAVSEGILKKSDVLEKLKENEAEKKNSTSVKKKNGNLLIKIGVPIILISVCLCITLIFLKTAVSNMDTIRGRFVISSGESASFIEFNSSGTYKMSDDGVNISKNGKWEYNGGNIVLSPYGDMERCECTFADRKYFAIRDGDFLKGSIPEQSSFDAEVTSESGKTYGFTKDGNFYETESGRHTELGTYIVDGSFITVNTDGNIHTFLKCGDGITEKYYVHS